MIGFCKICKIRKDLFDYGLCKECDLWLLKNKDEVYKIKYGDQDGR